MDLKSLIEAKQAEGKKPSKDKNSVVEPGVIDYSVLTEPFIMQNIPADFIQKSLAFYFHCHLNTVKKGFVLDLWEKEIVPDLATIIDWKTIFNKEEARLDSSNIPVDIVVELLV
jgi:hypothetical protein